MTTKDTIYWRIQRNTHRIASDATRYKVAYGRMAPAPLSGRWHWYAVWEELFPTEEAARAARKLTTWNGSPVVGELTRKMMREGNYE